MSEYSKYLEKLEEQRTFPPVIKSRACGKATELRFQTNDNPNGTWLWFKSQFAAAKWLCHEALGLDYEEVGKITYLVRLPRYKSDARRGKWAARISKYNTGPGLRGWYMLRQKWKLRTLIMYWIGRTVETVYGPTGAGRKRDRAAFELEFT